MDHFADERDFRLLEQDLYTFAVLSRVLRGPCNSILTDHGQMILCHTAMPYPVWIWTPDELSAEAKEQAYQLATSSFLPAQGFRYNLKYALAEYFLTRARQDGVSLCISTNMFAYDCPAPVAPDKPTDGCLHLCTAGDTDAAGEMIFGFHDAINADRQDMESCRMKAAQHISHEGFFFWKNSQGENVACCSWHPNGSLGCVGSVYTRPEHRRRHYAQHLVYQVTRMIAERGLTPMLYTDADYAASNACYEKIGYQLRGKLCTLGAE